MMYRKVEQVLKSIDKNLLYIEGGEGGRNYNPAYLKEAIRQTRQAK